MLKICAAICSLMGSAIVLYAASTGAGGTAVTVHTPSWLTASL
jgi:hypothetical protein